MSADGRNIMVVSYRDLSRCLDKAFEELQQQSGSSAMQQHGQPIQGGMGYA